jgi:hypothetical protein
MQQWHPDAIRVVGRHAGSHEPDAGWKIVHHTTEGSSAAGAIAAYRSHGGWPHFTAEWTGDRLRIYQHLPLELAARALVNGPEAGETNRARAVQIEHVGFAASSEDWPDGRCAAIGSLCRWIERQTGCPAVRLAGTTWGTDSPPRLGGMQFHGGRGHAAHQHVPGNIHWDWGQGRITAVLDVDDTAHRLLRNGATGADVAAFQRALNRHGRWFKRSDLHVTEDGVVGPQTLRVAGMVVYLLGVGRGPKHIAQNGISVHEQLTARRPSIRSKVHKAQAKRRQRVARRRHRKENA